KLGELRALQGRYSAAEAILQRVHQTAEQLGESHPGVAASLLSLSNLYRLEGNIARAEPLLRRAFALYARIFGPDSTSVAMILLNMALHSISQRKLSVAESEIVRALKILRKQTRVSEIVIAMAENSLATVYGQQGKYAEAERLFAQACPTLEKSYPGGHIEV